MYIALTRDCRACPLQEKRAPNMPFRRLRRDINEDARDVARALVDTPEFEKSRNETQEGRDARGWDTECVVKTRGMNLFWDKICQVPDDWTDGDRRKGGEHRMLAFTWNCRNQCFDGKGEAQAAKTARREYRCRALGRTDLGLAPVARDLRGTVRYPSHNIFHADTEADLSD